VPIHVRVEAAITKGKYHDYETFLGAEVISYLRLCLDKRRQDSPDEKVPAEGIVDDSPLIRDAQSAQPKPVGEKQLYKLIHGLYCAAGLLRKMEMEATTSGSIAYANSSNPSSWH
jgi:hypothetical protein